MVPNSIAPTPTPKTSIAPTYYNLTPTPTPTTYNVTKGEQKYNFVGLLKKRD